MAEGFSVEESISTFTLAFKTPGKGTHVKLTGKGSFTTQRFLVPHETIGCGVKGCRPWKKENNELYA